MTPEQQMEQFSFAYVRAVAAAARVNVGRPEVDTDSVDFRFSVSSSIGRIPPPIVEAQVKCTSKAAERGKPIRFPLKAKNYNELIGKRYFPRVLIVVVVPKSPKEWLVQDEQSLALFGCGYWVSLESEPERANTSSVTVVIPRKQIFSVEVLQGLLGLGR
jgi:Domain of unknown function (DUF4365)